VGEGAGLEGGIRQAKIFPPFSSIGKWRAQPALGEKNIKASHFIISDL